MAFPKRLYTIEDYWNIPDDTRAELIDGQFYSQAAPSLIHQQILSDLFIKIGHYIKSNNGKCRIFPAPFAVQLKEDENTIVEPDISIICDPNKLNSKGCIGAPDWIIEIVSPSNSSHDYVLKLNKYLTAGVKEYWIVDPAIETVYVYYFDHDHTHLSHYTFQDMIPSKTYDGFHIDFKEIGV